VGVRGLVDDGEVRVGDALGRVADHDRHVAALGRLDRPDLAVALDRLAGLAAPAQARGVDHGDLAPRRPGAACPPDRASCRERRARPPAPRRGWRSGSSSADVGAADDRDRRRRDAIQVRCGRVGQARHDLVEELAGAAPCTAETGTTSRPRGSRAAARPPPYASRRTCSRPRSRAGRARRRRSASSRSRGRATVTSTTKSRKVGLVDRQRGLGGHLAADRRRVGRRRMRRCP